MVAVQVICFLFADYTFTGKGGYSGLHRL